MQLPEVLAPAGDDESLHAAVEAGADAVYFGLQGFNARARATNFDAAGLAATMRYLHEHGRRGYVTLNTLVFDGELPALEAAVRACAAAGVDAVIVQDLGVARLVREVAPTLPLHASTQMTCTDAASVELAAALGAERVILARELSLDDIAAIRAGAPGVEVEVFVHGALCISYSGQCLTSEAIGGRSANRGACAQACRLPYSLVVDGVVCEDGEDDQAYLLSPEDLEASRLVPQLAALGVSSLKIEGRLKGPAYVAATTRLYREAVDAVAGRRAAPAEATRRAALQAYSRGSGPGFFPGVDHQRLVEGRTCEHRGLLIGTSGGLRRDRGRALVQVALTDELRLGDGLMIEGGRASAGELGGRVWAILDGRGKELQHASGPCDVAVWLGPDRDVSTVVSSRRVFRTSAAVESAPVAPTTRPLDLVVSGSIGEAPLFVATTDWGARAEVRGEAPLEVARRQPLDEAVLRDKLGQLGDTPYRLRRLTVELPAGVMLPLSSLKSARRKIVEALQHAADRSHATTQVSAASLVTLPLPAQAPPPAGLFVVCRNLGQARAALAAGASGVYLDFLELTGTGEAFRALKSEGAAFVGLAPPRIRKPGEEKIDRYLLGLSPDAVLVRSLGALGDGDRSTMRIGDFSLNVTNRISAREVLGHGLAAFTPSFDLDAGQLATFLDRELAPLAELVVHHPMPLFHMEHCAIAALLSDGRDYKTCGRPCDRHQVSLRDRAGMDHPVEADVGCRNTVFHAASQSAADLVPRLRAAGVRRFRIELVRQDAVETANVVAAYRALLAGSLPPAELWRTLRTEGGYGVVRGSLRVLAS